MSERTLNLDLTRFSKKELQDEITSCSEILVFTEGKIRESRAIYNKMLSKRFVRPIKLANAKLEVDNYLLLKNINDKYSRLLLDESNRRGRVERDKNNKDERN